MRRKLGRHHGRYILLYRLLIASAVYFGHTLCVRGVDLHPNTGLRLLVGRWTPLAKTLSSIDPTSTETRLYTVQLPPLFKMGSARFDIGHCFGQESKSLVAIRLEKRSCIFFADTVRGQKRYCSLPLDSGRSLRCRFPFLEMRLPWTHNPPCIISEPRRSSIQHSVSPRDIPYYEAKSENEG